MVNVAASAFLRCDTSLACFVNEGVVYDRDGGDEGGGVGDGTYTLTGEYFIPRCVAADLVAGVRRASVRERGCMKS